MNRIFLYILAILGLLIIYSTLGGYLEVIFPTTPPGIWAQYGFGFGALFMTLLMYILDLLEGSKRRKS